MLYHDIPSQSVDIFKVSIPILNLHFILSFSLAFLLFIITYSTPISIYSSLSPSRILISSFPQTQSLYFHPLLFHSSYSSLSYS
ncbi:hypothetical protein PENTCL1PPCAC_23210, partial [Pristionchus entomophagus]